MLEFPLAMATGEDGSLQLTAVSYLWKIKGKECNSLTYYTWIVDKDSGSSPCCFPFFFSSDDLIHQKQRKQ